MNRRYLKKRISEIFYRAEEAQKDMSPLYPQVTISLELVQKMENQLISYEDVQRIIKDAEYTDMKHFDAETGHSIAHGAVGVTTCWVVYEEKDAGFRLINVYSHRMKAVEEA